MKSLGIVQALVRLESLDTIIHVLGRFETVVQANSVPDWKWIGTNSEARETTFGKFGIHVLGCFQTVVQASSAPD